MNLGERIDLQYLFWAYSAVWVIMCGFLVRMDRRSRRLERDLALLQETYGLTEKANPAETPDRSWPGPSV